MRTNRLLVGAFLAGAVAAAVTAAPEDGLLRAFDRNDVVAVADQRGVEQLATLIAAVASSDGFVTRGIEIVVDWASPGHQKTLDAYLAGESIAANAIRSAVSSAPAFNTSGAPRSYDTLLAALRAANTGRPAARRIRLWSPAAAATDKTGALAARVLERLAAGKKVLLMGDPMELVSGGVRLIRMAPGAPGAAGVTVTTQGETDVPRTRQPTGSAPETAASGQAPGPGGTPRIVTRGPGGPRDPALANLVETQSAIKSLRDARPGRVLAVFPYCGLDDAAAGERVEAALGAAGVGSVVSLRGWSAAAALENSTGRDLAGGMLVGPTIASMDSLLYLGPVASLTVAPVRLSEKSAYLVDVAARRPKEGQGWEIRTGTTGSR